MQFAVLARDDAVSPVVGVVLLVAVVVLLSSTVGTVALGLTEGLSSSPPRAVLAFEFEERGGSKDQGLDDGAAVESGRGGDLTITHAGGDVLPGNDLRLRDDDGGDLAFPGGPVGLFGDPPYPVSAGDSVEVPVNSDDTVRVVWVGEEGETAVVGSWRGPDSG
ncbi:type IV pilin [Haloglomus litoreum]|uniref:type IV pilin n=1 Tax=Haloglomus litoreum TaxID=3034026 RepID=UPI0023E7BAB0|nr:type IV pilin [Haloglomus sp. DT116]